MCIRDRAEVQELTLSWNPEPVVADFRKVAPWLAEVAIAAEWPEAGWTLRIETPDGVVRLPELPAGTYRWMLRTQSGGLPLIALPPLDPPAGQLVLKPAGSRSFVGRLVLAEPLTSGKLRIHVER